MGRKRTGTAWEKPKGSGAWLAAITLADGSRETEKVPPRKSCAPVDAAYVEAVARLCGGIAADQCAPGEEWAPADWLAGDIGSVREAAEAVGVTLDGADLRRLWSIYCEGDVRAAADHGAC